MPVVTYPIVVSDIRSIADSDDLEQVRHGLADAFSYVSAPELEAALHEADNHPALLAFDKQILDETIAEVTPAVIELVEAAIRRRLPWEWPPPAKP